ncbi:ATP-dependent DNA helicase [archaeon]|nr:ATP-dependent DNA helicase [archaeon]
MVSNERKKELLFPYDIVRDEQNKLLLLTDATIENRRNLIVHAPTGLGKTAAALAPALAHAIKKDLTILFLTSRHTQHKIAIDTLKEIKNKYGNNFGSVSIIGKKWMCLVPGVQTLYGKDFLEYCKKAREERKCDFYNNIRKTATKFTDSADILLKQIHNKGPMDTKEVINQGDMHKMCPYEISLGMASKAKVIIADYYYLFNEHINQNFLARINKDLDKLIVIVYEAHNLPYRLKDLASEFLTSVVVDRSIKEAKKFGYDNTVEILEEIKHTLDKLSQGMSPGDEKTITRNMFEGSLNDKYDYDQLIGDLAHVADSIREVNKRSYIGGIANFMEMWQGDEEGFVRIISYKRGSREPFISLSYRCLDASVVSKEIINNTHSTILMSGTLLPTSMYKELLGVESVQEVVFKDPFPKDNRLNLIIPKTTTKYTSRNEKMYEEIATTLAEMVNKIPGNSAIFFPSYFLRDQVLRHFDVKSIKTVFSEQPGLGKDEKQALLENFKSYKDIGAVLLAVASGSFGEGIDLPGDLLKAVIVVGLPLSQPDLETKSLIEYFDKKFSKGWDYGYLFPAFNKTLQNAGRCIRSGTDRGIIAFLDERYVWKNYRRCFPEDWDMVVSTNYMGMIEEFFDS